MNKKELENKIWYRFLKVVYFTVLVFVIFLAIAIVIADKPLHITIDYANSFIKCNEKPIKFNMDTNNISVKGNKELYYTDDLNFKIECSQYSEGLKKYGGRPASSNPTNYTLDIKYKPNPAYKEWIGGIFIGFGIIAGFFVFIRYTFFYILLGNKKD